MAKDTFYKNRAPDPDSSPGPDRDCCEQLQSAYGLLIASFGPAFLSLEKEIANIRPKESSWSFLECMMHLVLTVQPYLKVLENLEFYGLHFERKAEPFLSSLFTKQIIRLERASFRVPAPKSLKPEYRVYEPQKVCSELVFCYQSLLSSLERVPEDSVLANVRIKLPTFKLIKFSLEQVFLLHLMHGRRHLYQATTATAFVNQLQLKNSK